MTNNMELSDRQLEIIRAALALLAEKGFAELSLRDIAQKLGVKAPAIYWHFSSKAVLVDYMAEYILREGLGDFRPRSGGESWQIWLTNHMAALRQAMLAYPDGGRIVAGARLFPAVTLAKSMEYSLASLRSEEMDLLTASHVVTTTLRYTFGYVIEEQVSQVTGDIPPDEVWSAYPNLSEALRGASGDDEAYLIGLGYIIRGASLTL
jgi:TetR/AcrR family tetracycline transcriptional repressor